MTRMSSARRSASSRYWVVSSRVGAPSDQLPDELPHVVAAAGVEAGGGLVEEEDGRLGDEGAGHVEPATHAPGVGLHRPVPGLGQVEAFQQLPGPLARLGLPEPVEPAHHVEVLESGQVLVDGGVLAGEPDALPDRLGIGAHVDAGDLDRAGVGLEQGGEDADGRRLAGAVGPEQSEHGALGDDQVEPVEGGDIPEALDQPRGADHLSHGVSSRTSGLLRPDAASSDSRVEARSAGGQQPSRVFPAPRPPSGGRVVAFGWLCSYRPPRPST
jgi:hypothetical protein